MATFEQLPGELDLTFVAGDELRLNCDFDANVTGYTVTNSIYVNSIFSAGGGNGFINTIGSTVTNFDQTVVSAASGTMLLVLPEQKSLQLSPAVGYRWYLRWVDTNSVTRTVLSGKLTVVSP